MSPSLAELQEAVADRILGCGGDAVEAWIRVPEGIDPGLRLAVHTEGYGARVTASLRESFPAVAHIAGGEAFAALGERYLSGIPGDMRNLNYVGARLPELLVSDSLTDALPFLPDLARLEWAVLRCFHARTVEPFDLSACAQWGEEDWAAARIAFAPGVAVVRSAWPIRDLHATRDLPREEIDIHVVGRPDHALVYRMGFEVVTESLTEWQARVFEELARGQALGETMAGLAGGENTPGSEAVVSLFGHWAGLGLVSGVRRG
jgi:hypothetical protein